MTRRYDDGEPRRAAYTQNAHKTSDFHHATRPADRMAEWINNIIIPCNPPTDRHHPTSQSITVSWASIDDIKRSRYYDCGEYFHVSLMPVSTTTTSKPTSSHSPASEHHNHYGFYQQQRWPQYCRYSVEITTADIVFMHMHNMIPTSCAPCCNTTTMNDGILTLTRPYCVLIGSLSW